MFGVGFSLLLFIQFISPHYPAGFSFIFVSAMKHLSSLNKYFWKYRWHFMLGFIFVVLTNYFRILSPQLTGFVVNTVVQSIKTPAGNSNTVDTKKNEKNYDFVVREVISKFEQSPSHKILF